jgi:hypothetical protein
LPSERLFALVKSFLESVYKENRKQPNALRS